MAYSSDYYRIFYYVARYHSFNRAAKVLLNSQPNIARAINNLEADLGCALFERSHRGVTLTEQGEVFFEYVRVAQESIANGLEAIRRMNQDRKNLVSLGFSIGLTDYTLRNHILPPVRSFSHANPSVNLRFHNDSTPQLIERVQNGDLDLAIITTTEGADPELRENILYQFTDVPIAGNGFRSKLYGKKFSLAELIQYPIITLSRDTETFAFHDQLFAKRGLVLKPYIESPSVRQSLAFVESDMGIAAIAEEYAQPALEKGTVFRIEMNNVLPLREISLIKNKRFRSRAVIELEKQILEHNNNNLK